MVNVGLIGCGYWGPNLIRNFMKVRECRLEAVADQRADRREAVLRLNPAMRSFTSAEELIESDSIDAVVIATPISTHYDLAKASLLRGKHVFVEKPLTRTSEQAKELIALAKEYRKVLMVDHTFIYSGAVRKLREIIDSGDLGEIYYYDSVRLNLGLFQPDVNVLWDLAPHDFSLLTYLLDKKPADVTASGSSPVRWKGWKRESIVYVTVGLEDSTIGHFHLNWLSPVKLRRTLIGGSRKMIVYDHLDVENQVKVFDKGVDLHQDEERYKVLVQYRTGDLLVPKVDQTEPLELACGHFIDCIQKGQTPITDGKAGLKVVELLEAAEESMTARFEKEQRKGAQPWEPTRTTLLPINA
ncbi:MAG TPA: Gfo/Idh/MocA family oxidoreductase [Terriglobia bacterium]|nr:Gfo/Idh/MocA family oxidoreductase [Terriglobia bacterium]